MLGKYEQMKYGLVSYEPDLEVLRVERIQLIDAVLNLCTYHHPENIQLPAGFVTAL